jgi:hypothetical protein
MMCRGGNQMKSRNTILSAAAPALAAAFAFATAAPAQAGGGSLSGTYAGWGTLQAVQFGKDRLLTVQDHRALPVSSDPMFAHLTTHCWVWGDFTKGVGQVRGYCLFTDPAGDQFLSNFASENFSPGKTAVFKLPFTLTAGTGKFAGITGSGTYVDDANTLKAPPGIYFVHGSIEGSYKLP